MRKIVGVNKCGTIANHIAYTDWDVGHDINAPSSGHLYTRDNPGEVFVKKIVVVTSAFFQIRRTILEFQLSASLPQGMTITGVNLKLHGQDVSGNEPTNLIAVKSTGSIGGGSDYPTGVDYYNFVGQEDGWDGDDAGTEVVKLSSEFGSSGSTWNESDYNIIPFNSDGIAHVQSASDAIASGGDGFSRLMLMEFDHDFKDKTPTVTNDSYQLSFIQSSGSNEPQLEIDYMSEKGNFHLKSGKMEVVNGKFEL